MARIVAALCLIGLLAACGPETLLSTGLGVASMKTTKKTLTDHAVGLVTDRDCSLLRAERGDSWCLTDEELEARVPAQPEFCYRTIGGITCYDRPDETKLSSRMLY